MKKLILLLPLLLMACAQSSSDLAAKSTQKGFVSFATLSNSDDAISVTSSVVYTKLAKFRFNAASLLRSGDISKTTAKWALTESDNIRLFLDAAVHNRDLEYIEQARKELHDIDLQLNKSKK